MSISKKIRDQICVEETISLLMVLCTKFYSGARIGAEEKDRAIELKARLQRLYMDIKSPCIECEHHSCPWRNDSIEECIYYKEMTRCAEKHPFAKNVICPECGRSGNVIIVGGVRDNGVDKTEYRCMDCHSELFYV